MITDTASMNSRASLRSALTCFQYWRESLLNPPSRFNPSGSPPTRSTRPLGEDNASAPTAGPESPTERSLSPSTDRPPASSGPSVSSRAASPARAARVRDRALGSASATTMRRAASTPSSKSSTTRGASPRGAAFVHEEVSTTRGTKSHTRRTRASRAVTRTREPSELQHGLGPTSARSCEAFRTSSRTIRKRGHGPSLVPVLCRRRTRCCMTSTSRSVPSSTEPIEGGISGQCMLANMSC
mmetsp:Transcript_4117/g.15222  ORF Transcript_4117/g.15222 Transcript_4117/m.15222 type:complete len:241 (-) Transcript_4117:544-1266(-)